MATSNIGDIRSDPKLFNIVEATISYLENRYDTPIQYHHNWQVIILAHEEIQQRWCDDERDAKKYADCVSAGDVYAYYEVSTGSIILPRIMNLDRTHDVATVVHEVVHYMQDRHGLTWRGNYHKCAAWLELEAMKIEMEVVNLLELHRPSWYLEHNSEWQEKWRSKLDANGNCV